MVFPRDLLQTELRPTRNGQPASRGREFPTSVLENETGGGFRHPPTGRIFVPEGKVFHGHFNRRQFRPRGAAGRGGRALSPGRLITPHQVNGLHLDAQRLVARIIQALPIEGHGGLFDFQRGEWHSFTGDPAAVRP